MYIYIYRYRYIKQENAENLASIFGKQLIGVGRMLIVFNSAQNPRHAASAYRMNCRVLLSSKPGGSIINALWYDVCAMLWLRPSRF